MYCLPKLKQKWNWSKWYEVSLVNVGFYLVAFWSSEPRMFLADISLLFPAYTKAELSFHFWNMIFSSTCATEGLGKFKRKHANIIIIIMNYVIEIISVLLKITTTKMDYWLPVPFICPNVSKPSAQSWHECHRHYGKPLSFWNSSWRQGEISVNT